MRQRGLVWGQELYVFLLQRTSMPIAVAGLKVRTSRSKMAGSMLVPCCAGSHQPDDVTPRCWLPRGHRATGGLPHSSLARLARLIAFPVTALRAFDAALPAATQSEAAVAVGAARAFVSHFALPVAADVAAVGATDIAAARLAAGTTPG